MSQQERQRHLEQARESRHHFVQAAVPPMDEDGAIALWVGTVGFVIASVWLWLSDGLLARIGGWWLTMTLSGAVVGLVVLGYVYLRRYRRRTGTNGARN